MSSDEDKARLLAALILALQRANLGGSTDTSFETKLAQLGDAMAGSRWQVTAARDLKLNIWSWIARPWHCWKLQKLVRLMLHEELDPRQEADAISLLTRCAALVEFGVDVNAKWYRRLRGLVASGRITSRDLRSLLRRSTVWWGTDQATGASQRPVDSLARRLWAAGRPARGELFIAEHHWVTRLLLRTLLALSSLPLVIAVIGIALHLLDKGNAPDPAQLMVALYTYGLLAWAAWWLGPHSWSAVKQLHDLLDLDSSR